MAAADAALAVAHRLGLALGRAQVVTVGTHVPVKLEPGPIAARGADEGILTQFARALDAEVRVAAQLHAADAPVVPPLIDRAADCDGRRVTLWRWWDSGRDDSAEAIGASLAHCHRVLSDVDVDLRP